MVSTAPQHESKLIVLTDLENEIDHALDNKKWVTVIDKDGNAETFFKYQGTNVFSILEKEVDPANLCRSLLTIIKFASTMTINYLDLPYQSIFNEKFFPQEVIDAAWLLEFKNVEKLRQNCLGEFPDEIKPNKKFNLVFLFGKDNVPPLFHEKTIVLEICSPKEISERLAEREAKANAKKPQEEKKFEEKKVDPTKATNAKTAVNGTKTGTAAKTSTTAAKTTGTPTKTTTTAAKPAGTTATKPTGTTATKPTGTTPTKTTTAAATKPTTTAPKTTTTAPKTTTTTAKPAVNTKPVKK